MTQQHIFRMAGFRAGSLPDPRTLPDSLIVEQSIDGTEHRLLQSDGVNWNPVSDTPDVSSTAAAIAGLENTTVITPLRLAEVLVALGLIGAAGDNGYVSAGYVTAGYVHA